MTKNKARNIILFGFIFLLLPLLFSVLNLYTDWLFFTETGYTSVFLKTLSTKISTGIFFGIAFLAFVLANIIIANRTNFPQREISAIEGVINPFRAGGIEKVVKPLTIIAGVVMAIFAVQWGALRWEDFLLFRNSLDMGTNDPLLGKDIGFYLFKLPLIESLNGFAGFTLALTIIVVAANYFLRGGIFILERIISVDGKVKKHLSILAGLVILNIGFGFYLDTFRLLFSEHGAVYGAGYMDVHAKLFFYRILMVITPLAGFAFIAGIVRGSRKLTFSAPVLVLAVYIIGIVAYPYVLHKFKVAPNELALETPYIEQNIKFTRLGYNLDKIEVRPFDVDYNLSGKDIEKNDATIKNIRLWDHSPLLRTYSQLQQIRTYYKFADVDNDRYTINGEYMQVMLAPRELSYNDLPSKNWINERLIFTHGNGITLGPVSRISREGLPEFLIKDIPPVSQADLKVARPEIYYGELSNNYVIVKTKVPEFSYPTSEGNVYTTYEGSGGVRLDSLFKRALFSVKYKTEKILLSSDISGESKILYYRNILDRVRAVVPFLLFDEDPYMIVTKEGRLLWIADAYTVSNRMPYSKPIEKRINYIRNSVKVIIDAYNGSMGFYVSDSSDILIKVYSKIFPNVFKSPQEMPEELRQHIRYPHRLLQIQASMFAAYHMTDPQVFYNKENLWEVPAFGEMLMEPYYTIMKLPGEKKEEYILLLPYTPAKRDNLAAWLAARCDEPDYGKLIIYTFPRDRLIFGPKQVDARINQDSYISQQLTLWGQYGSEVIRGSLLVIPIERSLLYVQPLYLAASDKVGLPELRRVIVAYENDVVMEENLELALQRLFGAKAMVGKADRTEDIKSTTTDLAKEAMGVFERAIELQRQGNWAGYGEEIKKLEQLLKRIAK
ncbi:MAG: hypothetical protein AMK74_04830 [Nitrospira bacterium SM23_35]|nr:MAG: hypothetical protein AMK74_04830 [Nitrospira bacterium SM23_35]